MWEWASASYHEHHYIHTPLPTVSNINETAILQLLVVVPFPFHVVQKSVIMVNSVKTMNAAQTVRVIMQYIPILQLEKEILAVKINQKFFFYPKTFKHVEPRIFLLGYLTLV